MAESDLQSLSISLFDTPFGKEKGQPSLLDLVKKACADKNFPVLKYILQSTNFVPTEPVDEFGNTILHFIIQNLDDMGGLPFLQSFLANPNVKKIINVLSKKDGMTPAIAACALRQFKVVDMLAEAGADLKIPSRDGTTIATATETEVKRDTKVPEDKEENMVSNFLTRIWRPMTQKASEVTPEVTTIGLSGMSASVPTPSKHEVLPKISPVASGQLSELSTEAFIKGVMNGTMKAPQQETPKIASGGSRSVAVGQRFLNKVPEYSSISGGSSESEKKKKKVRRTSGRSSERKSETRGSFELGRITDDIHARTVETIKSLMGVDEETAKAYKSVLYYRVKEEHPDMSSYERANEMEKLATKAVLKEIDIEAAKKKRDEFKAASASSSESETEKKPRKKKVETSETSSESEKKPKRKPKKSESTSETTSSPELDTNLSM